MTTRVTAIAFAVIAIVLTVAQDVLPARDWYHSWQYVTILAVAIVFMVRYVLGVWRKRTPEQRSALAIAGGIAVAVAGLLSGLIGPDTVTVVGTPGTVTPVADLNAAAFFPATDARAIARGDATILLRSRSAGAAPIGTRPVPIGLSVVFAQLRPAAYIVARDASGNRLTVTQPSNPAFLSPVMLFRQTQDIHGRVLPLDTFAVPALHRIVRVLYFSAADLTAVRQDPSAPAATQPGAILSVTDDAGAQQGIAMAASGVETAAGGVRVTVTLGSYPVLQVASAPQPLVTIAGIVLFLGALLWSAIRGTPAQPVPPEQAAEAAAAGVPDDTAAAEAPGGTPVPS